MADKKRGNWVIVVSAGTGARMGGNVSVLTAAYGVPLLDGDAAFAVAVVEMDDGQGLCWHQIKFEALWGHSGGDPGVATYMFFNPKTRIGVITFQNNHNGDLFSVVRKLYAVADNL